MEYRPVSFDEPSIKAALSAVALGGLRVVQSLGSTNDEALTWASQGAADLSLVVADEQTAGRGRSNRHWLTPPGVALALSVILRSGARRPDSSGRLAGLGAVAVADACASLGLQPSIKWPNDVLLDGRKVAGVLVEAQWSSDHLEAAVIGIGINVLKPSAPLDARVHFPATSIEHALAHPVDRIEVLRRVILSLVTWRSRLHTREFLEAWDGRLAFRGSQVALLRDGHPVVTGLLLGLEDDGSLRLMVGERETTVPTGELQLRPADDRMA